MFGYCEGGEFHASHDALRLFFSHFASRLVVSLVPTEVLLRRFTDSAVVQGKFVSACLHFDPSSTKIDTSVFDKFMIIFFFKDLLLGCFDLQMKKWFTGLKQSSECLKYTWVLYSKTTHARSKGMFEVRSRL